MAVPRVVIFGAQKGGVGKTMLSRASIPFFKERGLSPQAFDTQTPDGVLKRFHPEITKVVDLTTSQGVMTVFDNLNAAPVSVIDIEAGVMFQTLETLANVGFLEKVRNNQLKITVVHILGPSEASYEEIKTAANLMLGCRYILAQNYTNDSAFRGLSEDQKAIGQGLIKIPKMDAYAAEAVDLTGQPFDVYINDGGNSETVRGYVRFWLGNVHKQFDAVQLHAST
jgi:hypothetical protein